MKFKKALLFSALLLPLTSCVDTKPVPLDDHTHTFSEEWSFDKTYHWHASTCGHDVSSGKEEHVFDQTIVQDSTTLKNALSCTEPARYYKTCICGAISTSENDVYEVGTPTGHTYSTDWSYDKEHHWHAATCEHSNEKNDFGNHDFSGGYKLTEDETKHYLECECGYATTPEDHIFTKWTVTKDATMVNEGEKYSFCDLCGKKVVETIPKLYALVDEVNCLIEKIGQLSTIEMFDGTLIEEAKNAYENLSENEKDLVINYSVLKKSVDEWEEKYEMVYDPLINGIPTIEGHSTSLENDDEFGTVLKINLPSTDTTSEFCFSINSNKYRSDSVLHIFIKSPFETLDNTSQTFWIGSFDRNYTHNLNPSGWTEITGLGKNFSPSENNANRLVENLTLQRFINGTISEYSGDYLMAAIIAEKINVKDGDIVIEVNENSINKINTWGGDESTVTNNSDVIYGNGAKLSITAISGAYEIQINGVNKTRISLYDYIYCFVYAPVSSKYYFSQLEWRNNVMTSGVDPTNASEAANKQAAYEQGWTKITIPTAYFPNDNSIYFEIYNENALGDWIITDFYGGVYDVANLVDFKVQMPSNRDFRILQLTDTQIIDSSQMRSQDRLSSANIEAWKRENINSCCFDQIKSLINKEHPDLIIITGDIVYGEFDDSGEIWKMIIDFMESFEIPWAPVFGNHDNESYKGVDWQCEQLEKAEYCLFKKGNLTGNGNYSIGLVDEKGNIKRVIYMLDSNGCLRNAGFGSDQLVWMNKTSRIIDETYEDNIPAFACFHIATKDFKVAYEEKYGYSSAQSFNLNSNGRDGDFGQKNEEPSCFDTELATEFKKMNVDGVFVGHDHVNNYSILYNGIRYTYGTKTGFYDYFHSDMIGGTTIKLTRDSSFIVSPSYMN